MTTQAKRTAFYTVWALFLLCGSMIDLIGAITVWQFG